MTVHAAFADAPPPEERGRFRLMTTDRTGRFTVEPDYAGYDMDDFVSAAGCLLNHCESWGATRVAAIEGYGRDVRDATEELAEQALAIWATRDEPWDTLPSAIADAAASAVEAMRADERTWLAPAWSN